MEIPGLKVCMLLGNFFISLFTFSVFSIMLWTQTWFTTRIHIYKLSYCHCQRLETSQIVMKQAKQFHLPVCFHSLQIQDAGWNHWWRWRCFSIAELVSDGSRVSLKLTAGMPAALSLLCLSRCCVCVHAETPDELLRCGWTSINSTTTLQGRQPRARPSAGLSIILSLSSIILQYRQKPRYRFGYVSYRIELHGFCLLW